MKLQTKFTLGLFVIISTLISLFSVVIYSQVSTRVTANADKLLREEMEHEWNHLWQHPEVENARGPHSDPHHKGIYLRIVDEDKHATKLDTFPPPLSSMADLPREQYLCASFQKSRNGSAYLLEGATDLTRLHQFLWLLRGMLITGCLVVVGLTGPASWWLAGWGFRPFRKLAEQTALLEATDLAFRFSAPKEASRDEYLKLVDSFNLLLGRLDKAFTELNLFAAKAAHELKTPLTAMMAQMQMQLRRDDLPPQTKESLGKMLAQGARLARVTEQLLNLAAVDSRRRMPAVPPADAADLLRTLIETYGPIAQQTGKMIEVSGVDSPIFVTDSDLLATAVSNLLDNALKFSRTIVRFGITKEGDRIVVEVEDDGPGIPQGQYETVTAPFTRTLNLSDGIKNPGSGLGLAIVKAATVSLKAQLTFGKSRWSGLLARLSVPSAKRT